MYRESKIEKDWEVPGTFVGIRLYEVDSIANTIAYGREMFDFKIKKRFNSENHIFLLKIPSEYGIQMPDPSEHLEKILYLQMKVCELDRKKTMNPELDITKEKDELDQESASYMDEKNKK